MTPDSAADRSRSGPLAAVLRRGFRIVLVTLALVIAAAAVLLFVPRVFESTASLLVEGGAEDEPARQAALAVAPEVLAAAAGRLGLAEMAEFTGAAPSPFDPLVARFAYGAEAPEAEPGSEEMVLGRLAQRVSAAPAAGLPVIAITVRAEDAERAARIANVLAELLVERRGGAVVDLPPPAAETDAGLEAEIAAQQALVAEAEAAVAAFRAANGLDGEAAPSGADEAEIAGLGTRIAAAEGRRDAALARAAVIRGVIENGQPVEAVAELENAAVIRQLAAERAQLQGERAQLLVTLLPGHPNVQALTARLDEVERQIVAEAGAIAETLDAEAAIEAGAAEALRGELAGLDVGAGDAAEEVAAALAGLEAEAAAERALLETYLARRGDAPAAAVPAAVGGDAGVRIVALAVPAAMPVFPPTVAILAGVAIAALALQVAGVLLGALLFRRPKVVAAPEPERAPEPAAESPAGPAAETFDEPVPHAPTEPPAEPPETSLDDVAAALAEVEAEAGADDPDSFGDEAPGAGMSAEMPPLPSPGFVRQETARRLAALTDRIATGGERVVLVADLGAGLDYENVADRLVLDALAMGLSVAWVDAGSGQQTVDPGISDLSLGEADFGDVVHRGSRPGLAEIPWGQQERLDLGSERPATLIDALADIYEVVVVLTGGAGEGSSLPAFAGLDARLVLVTDPLAGEEMVAALAADAGALGFPRHEVVPAPPQVEVA